jgi:hypothetical protein
VRRGLAVLAVALLLAGIVGLVGAQSGYRLDWWTVDGGGGQLEGASGYALLGIVGQPDAGAPLTSASYTVTGGLLVGAASAQPEPGHQIFLPLVVRR